MSIESKNFSPKTETDPESAKTERTSEELEKIWEEKQKEVRGERKIESPDVKTKEAETATTKEKPAEAYKYKSEDARYQAYRKSLLAHKDSSGPWSEKDWLAYEQTMERKYAGFKADHPLPDEPEKVESDKVVDIEKTEKEKGKTESPLVKIGGQLGSTRGGWYEDGAKQEKFYVKFYEDSNQARVEYIANTIYSKLGINAVKSELKTVDGEEAIASPQIPGAKSVYKDYLEKNEDIRSGFVADAYLANWDVTGASYDNIIQDGGGKMYRVDNGGSLIFRARGGMKEYSPDQIPELQNMRNPEFPSGKIFGNISEKEMCQQAIKLVENLSEEDIDKIIAQSGCKAETAEIITAGLKGRREYLIKHFGIDLPPKSPDVKTAEKTESDKVVKIEKAEKIELDKAWESKLEKMEGCSETTKKYLKELHYSKFDGNPGIKDAIEDNVIQKEKEFEGYIKHYSEKRGLSKDEYIEKIQEHIERLVAQSDFFRATHVSVLDKIMLEDGRFKSQFETNRSDGYLNSGLRSGIEHKLFGFKNNEKENQEKRPIYGYFSSGSNGEINEDGKIPPPSDIRGYGKIAIKFKRDQIINNTTITMSDSLSNRVAVVPTPARKPHFTSFNFANKDPLNVKNSKIIQNSKYTEAQYSCWNEPLTMDKVESIHISEKNLMSPVEMEKVRDLFNKYKELHPESDLQLIEY